jgi:periplasmic copper chaperone A
LSNTEIERVNKTALVAALLSLGTLALGACGETADETAVEAPEGIAGLTVTNARLVLPAVAGNPAAVYFDLAYDGDRAIALNRIDVQGAESAEFHEYGEWAGQRQMQPMMALPLKKGEKYAFEPGGRHGMAMKLSPEVAEGGTVEVTVTVSGGDKQSFPAEVRAAGSER